jgi:predicted dehydrogenase
MRFALLGTHPVGLAMAHALVASGRHELLAYTSPDVASKHIGPGAKLVNDLEEVLADPAIDAVIVAGELDNRPTQLRRALQSERHVLCVHPADHSPDTGYEAAMIQGDTGHVLFSLLPDALHPGIARLTELLRQPEGPIGACRVLQIECHSAGEFLLDADQGESDAALPGWDVLRAIGGEISEVSGFAAEEELAPGQPLLLSGRFEAAGLFHVTLLPMDSRDQLTATWRATLIGERGRAELLFPHGWTGPAFLTWRDEAGELREEAWDAWDPWPVLIDCFESANALSPGTESRMPNAECRMPTWQDEVRCLELDDAFRRSLARRRTSVLEYPDATEEAGFKGTMTLVGCGLLWASLVLLILSRWFSWVGWLVVPVLAGFLALQLLRWVLPGERGTDKE